MNKKVSYTHQYLSRTETIKNTFGISAGNSPLIELLPKDELAAFIKDCANSKSKGNRYTTDALVALLSSLEHHDIPEYDSDKLAFVQSDWANKRSIIKQIESLVGTEITPNAHVHEIEKTPKQSGFYPAFTKINVSCVTMRILTGRRY